MKKVVSLFLLSSLIILFLSPAIQAWDDCPYGLENDPYPRRCPRYIDTDGDGICDYSQPPPGERGGISYNSSSSNSSSSTGNKWRIDDEAVKKIVVTFSIAIVAILLTEFIARKKKARGIVAYIWNIILLSLFIVSALSGVLLEFIKDLTLVTIHTVASLLFLWIGIYHVLKHAKYYIRKLRLSNKK